MTIRSFLRGVLGKLENMTWLQWSLFTVLLLAIVAILFSGLGLVGGIRAHQRALEQTALVDVQSQFDLGLADLEAGHYDLARQRFEYVIHQQPEHPGAIEALTQALIGAESTSNQTTNQLILAATPTATPDNRPLQELFAAAQSQFQQQDWQNLAQTIVAIRNVDPQYQVVALDRMLYLALRMGGIQKIINDGNLEGGVYDLALAEHFAPLDSEANTYRDWARLYQLGASFWGVYPDKSIYYFSQLAAAAPYLRDFSGIYASERYRLAIIQYGDQFARNGDWCAALEQYVLAQSLGEDITLQPTAANADEQCRVPVETTAVPPTLDQGGTPTASPVSPTATQMTIIEVSPTVENTATQAVVPTSTSEPSPTTTLTVTESSPTPISEGPE